MERLRGLRVRVTLTDERLVVGMTGVLEGWNEQFVFLTDDDGDYFAFNINVVGAISVPSETN